MANHTSMDIEAVKKWADLEVAEGRYGAPGIDVKGETVDSIHEIEWRPGKRNFLVCSDN